MSLDYKLLILINSFAYKSWWLDHIAIFFAIYAEYILVGIVLIYLLIGRNNKVEHKRNKIMVFFALVAALIARFGLGSLIHYFYFKLRPFAAHPDVVNLLIKYNETSDSFPSGHTLFFFAMASSVYFIHKKTGIFLLIASFFVAFSRIYIGVHYPIDILAGALLGIFIGYLVDRIGNHYWPKEIGIKD